MFIGTYAVNNDDSTMDTLANLPRSSKSTRLWPRYGLSAPRAGQYAVAIQSLATRPVKLPPGLLTNAKCLQVHRARCLSLQ